MSNELWPWQKWQIGNVVEDSGRNVQIVLFVDNDGSFKCMNDKGELNTYSCGCHTYKAKNVLEYYTKSDEQVLSEECDIIKKLKLEIKRNAAVIKFLKAEVINLKMEDKDTKVNFKHEIRNIFTLMTHRDKENRLLAISLAKSVFNMDCHDLCHMYKKQEIFANSNNYSGFVLILEVAEFLLNGWEFGSSMIPARGGFMENHNVIEFSLRKGVSEINMKLPEETTGLFMALLDKDYTLKNYAYRYLILNWDNDI